MRPDLEQQIGERQDDDESLELLLAADTAHRRAFLAELARAGVTAVFAVLAVVATLLPDLASPLAIAGIAGALVTTVIAPSVSARWNNCATLMQEAFDTRLFNLPWSPSLGTRPRHEESYELARRFEGDVDLKRRWYVDVAGLPLAYAVLLCQRENLLWDFTQRRRWASRLEAVVVIWVLIGIVLGLALDWTVFVLLQRWIAPSLPWILLGATESRDHRQTAAQKQDLALEVESLIAELPDSQPSVDLHASLMGRCRSIQDDIARLRMRTSRVPDAFYRRYRDEQEESARVGAERIRERFLA